MIDKGASDIGGSRPAPLVSALRVPSDKGPDSPARSNFDNCANHTLPNRRDFLRAIAAGLALSALDDTITLQTGAPEIVSRQQIGPFSDQVLEQARACTVRLHSKRGVGSGVIIKDLESGSLLAISARHVLSEDDKQIIESGDCSVPSSRGRVSRMHKNVVDISCYDPSSLEDPDLTGAPLAARHVDPGILKIMPEEAYCLSKVADLVALKIGPTEQLRQLNPQYARVRDLEKEPLQKGEDVFTVGNPHERYFEFSRGTVAKAVLNDPEVALFQDVIKLRMEVEPGNSGGPLFDNKGRLVGIVIKEHVTDPNVGYAVGVNHLLRLCSKWGIAPEI